MAPNERSSKNHDELFRGHISTLAVTEPELIEVFDNFTFDKLLRASDLDVQTRLMVQLAALITCQADRGAWPGQCVHRPTGRGSAPATVSHLPGPAAGQVRGCPGG
jgi:hypothetical protein